MRIVACGNFIPKRDEEDVFASGSDAVGVRTALKKGAIEDGAEPQRTSNPYTRWR